MGSKLRRLLPASQATREDKDKISNTEDGANGRDSATGLAPDENLTKWKQERLAHHHAYYALLDKSFVRWKQVTEERRQRRQRVIAACRVGARFFQRLYWSQWRERVSRRRAAQEVATTRLQAIGVQLQLRKFWSRWRRFAVKSMIQTRSGTPSNAALADRLMAEQRLEVRGVRMIPPAPYHQGNQPVLPVIPKIPVAPEPTEVQHHERHGKLREIIVFHTQRQYFQLWKQAADTLGNSLVRKQRVLKADRFCVQSAWRRWRRGYTARSDYDASTRRAVFFLYYQLTKSSLHRLQAHAHRQSRERGVTVVIANRARRRTLAAAVQMWRQRLHTKLVFTHWRDTAVGETCFSPSRDPRLEMVSDAISKGISNRLLLQFFSMWLDAYTRQRKTKAIARILQGPLSHAVLRHGLRLWRQHTIRRRQMEKWQCDRTHGQLAQVWRAWALATQQATKRELQRRTATRFHYYRTLHKAFTALQRLRGRRTKLDMAVARLVQSQIRSQIRRIVCRWREWSAIRCRRRQRLEQAVVNHRLTVQRRVLETLRSCVRETKIRGETATQFAQTTARHRLGLVFSKWKALCQHEQARNRDLASRLATYLDKRATHAIGTCFHVLDEHARSKTARRLVNAHAHGHFQARLVQRAFSMWSCSIAELKWTHIFIHRAQRFRDRTLQTTWFQRWRAHAHALKQNRERTKLVLHHWKKAREKAVFAAWRRYVAGKRVQRERIHAALEFRHRAFVRDGLSRWISGATYLAEQRARRTTESQATHTARVWRTVRAIALQWRWRTQQKRHTMARRSDRVRVGVGRPRNGIDDDDVGATFTIQQPRIGRLAHSPAMRRPARDQLHPSVLSEFVMLPRNRPRPRKPIDLILDTGCSPYHPELEGEETETSRERRDLQPESANEALQSVNHRYGFQFPTPTVTPTAAPTATVPAVSVPTSVAMTTSRLPVVGNARSSHPVDPASVYDGWTIDELEKRLLYWHDRRLRFKQLQQSLADFRVLLDQASTEKTLPLHDLQHMVSRLQAMEQREATSRQQWSDARAEIQSLAQRIKRLRAVSTDTPAEPA